MRPPGRGEIWWADLGAPAGSGPGFRRPVLVVQSDSYNRRPKLATIIVAILTSNATLSKVVGNVLLSAVESGLPRESVVNVTQLFTVEKRDLIELAGEVPPRLMLKVDEGLELVLDLVSPRW